MNKTLKVLYEDNHLIIVHKDFGDIVQKDKTGDSTLAEKVKVYLKKKYNKPGDVFLGIVHRLDRPTAGIVMFARTSKALVRLNKMFAEQKIQKTYLAIVEQAPPREEACLEHHLRRNPKQNKSYAFDTPVKNSKKARLSYSLTAASDKYYLLKINLHTGRHHQIRAQLAHISCPIKGDLKYGSKRSNPNGGIDLLAYSIHFIHPVSHKEITVTASTPEDNLWHFFLDP